MFSYGYGRSRRGLLDGDVEVRGSSCYGFWVKAVAAIDQLFAEFRQNLSPRKARLCRVVHPTYSKLQLCSLSLAAFSLFLSLFLSRARPFSEIRQKG